MTDTPAPDHARRPTEAPAPVRPGAPPADTVVLAAARAARVAAAVTDNPETRPLTTDHLVPTCMIYSMFAGLAVLLGTMLCWMLQALNALRLFQ